MTNLDDYLKKEDELLANLVRLKKLVWTNPSPSCCGDFDNWRVWMQQPDIMPFGFYTCGIVVG